MLIQWIRSASRFIKMGVFVAAAGLMFHIKLASRVASPICLSLVLLIAFAVSSVYWSVDPWLTLKRLIPLLGTTLVGVYFGARFTLHGFLKSAFVALFIMTAASLVVGSLLPEYGIRGTGLWAGFRGVFIHKNILGPIAVLSTMTSIYWTALNIERNRKWVWIGVGAVSMSVLCLVLTLSVSSYINALLALAILLSLRILQRAGRLRMPLMLCFACLTVLGVMESVANLAAISEVFGRDATLTGRTDIWRFAIHLIEREPLFGYGYAVAWDKLGWYFDVVHVHNGFLAVALDLGMIGLGLCVAFLVQVGWRCFSLLVRSEGFVSTWPAALFSLVLLGNVTEVNLLDGGKIQWCLLVFVASWTSIEVRGREHKTSGLIGAGSAPSW
jgi:exopolysaccharide production protein ExoQ